jgi:N-acetylmuramoyl-L-alanine amidase
MFTVEKDLLYGKGGLIPTFKTPHKSAGRNICDFIVIHFTGSHGDFLSSQRWAGDPNSKVSWHLTVGRLGEVNQCEHGFRSVLWHCGKSSWTAKQTGKTYQDLNKLAVGIEIANSGKLVKRGDHFYNSFNVLIDPKDVAFDKSGNPWERYTTQQLGMVYELCMCLAKQYNCIDILGHEEIAPGRKTDPGPLFPLDELRATLHKKDWYKWK